MSSVGRVRAALFFAVVIAGAVSAHAQSVAITPDGDIVVAHDRKLDVYRTNLHQPIATYDGVRYSGPIVTANERAAVLDPLHDEVRLVDLESGKATSLHVSGTPIAAMFDGTGLLVVCRDGGTVERIGPDGSRESLRTGAAPEFIRQNSGRTFVYSRVDGLLQQITFRPLAVARQIQVPPFASDMELDGTAAYLVYPREGVIRTISTDTLKIEGQARVGAVPVDVASGGASTALTARNLLIADPASKRVWVVEARQSAWQAFGRGFLRGILGLGLFGGRDSAFPTGVDRVIANPTVWLAYDTSSGTLYRISKKSSELMAAGIAPNAFALDSDRVVYWRDGTLVAAKLSR